MSRLLEIVEGWTGTLGPFTLRTDGTPVAIDPSWTIALLVRPSGTDDFIDTVGDLTVDADQEANPGQLYYDPDDDDFEAASSPYAIRFRVTDGDGKVVFFPNGLPDQIVVRAP